LPSLSTNEAISKNVGINKFLHKVYTTTGLAFGGALATSYAVLSIPALSTMMVPLAFGGFVATLAGFISSSYMKPNYFVEQERYNAREKIETIRSVNSPLRQAMFGLGVVGLGLSGAPLIAFASAVSPTIVPTCLGLTTAIFGGASLMAYNMKKDSMLKYSGVLFGSLLGLIGLQLGGLAAAMIMGPNVFSMMMLNSSSYIAVGLFSAFILYDTHVAIKMYELGTPDHLGIATQFILDIWNIFVSLLNIFSRD
jgi:FtsH-binding integral membrane protein